MIFARRDRVTGRRAGVRNAWIGGSIDEPPGKQIIIAPGELDRFHSTYWKIPPLDETWLRHPPPNVHIEGH